MTEGTPDKAPKGLWLYNWISLAGLAIGLVGAIAGIVLFAADTLLSSDLAYVGVFYILLAGVVALGAFVVLVGVLRERGRRRRGVSKPIALLTLDLTQRRDRLMALSTLVGGIVGVTIASAIAYESVHYMSSDPFCSDACHSVMAPEGISHKTSSHAQVECVACHVGEGAGSYVSAKLNGINQLIGVITGNYHRPIQTPVHNMRPAREICEQCHWAERFIGLKEKIYTHYEANEENTEHTTRLLLKVGGQKSGLVAGFGIHYHMQLTRKVEFIARDHQRQDIAWVRVTESDGKVKEFASKQKPLTAEEMAAATPRRMDCLDCHNRPAHQFPTPVNVINGLMEGGAVSTKIPFIKKKGMEVLSAEYETSQAAQAAIESGLREYYDKEHADFAKAEKPVLDAAIEAIKAGYARTNFPEMKANWKAYPDNLGHRDYPGCFRCHNEDLVTSGGEAIFTTCNKCHVLLQQNGNTVQTLEEGIVFHHYGDDSDIDAHTMCTDCHSGSGT